MTVLSVNINKIALIRNSRGSDLPNLLDFAKRCIEYGADGITVHPRPDERHIRYDDLPILKNNINRELNIEGYPSDRFMNMIEKIRPAQCTLVPDPPGVLTSSQGWDTIKNKSYLKDVCDQLNSWGVRSSIFVEPKIKFVEGARFCNAKRIELYTGQYSKKFNDKNFLELDKHIECSKIASKLHLGVNAGHDLNLDNLRSYKSNLFVLDEVSIGHAIVCDALKYGIQNTIGMYKNLLQ